MNRQPVPHCWECGQAVENQRQRVCSRTCLASLRLVFLGRQRREQEDLLPHSELRRQMASAGIPGRLPNQEELDTVRDAARDREGTVRCQVPGCHEEASYVDWGSDAEYPDDDCPRPSALNYRCAVHFQEGAKALVDEEGHIPHSARAVWARIEAPEPIVPRDDVVLWSLAGIRDTRGLARLLTSWPLADDQTERDYSRWIEAALARPVEPCLDIIDQLNGALDDPYLPIRRRRRVIRAFCAKVIEGHTTSRR